MLRLELTLPSPAENLALDEALLDEAEAGGAVRETLRLWESAQRMVVVGRSSRVAEEVELDACRREGVPVLRRASGGAAIVAGPGCLMYAVVLDMNERPALRAVDAAHRFVLGTIVEALRPLASEVRCRGTSDLVLGDRKFSGNSLRVKRDFLLYHGTLLLDFPLEEISRYLTMPPRMPDYRQRRRHGEFITNLKQPLGVVARALAAAFQADEACADWPAAPTAALVAEKYGTEEWNLGR